MAENKSKNREKYLKDNVNIYPYANSSKQLYQIMKFGLISEGVLLIAEMGRRLVQGLFHSLAKNPATPTSFKSLDDILNGYNNFVVGAYNFFSYPLFGPMKWIAYGLAGCAVLYAATIALRHHHGELRPFQDDRLARKMKSYILKHYELSFFEETNKEQKEANKKYEQQVRDAIKAMNVTINTRQEINGSDFLSIAKVSLIAPNNRTAAKMFLSKIKDLPNDLTDASNGDFVFGQALKSRDGREYFFLAEINKTEYYTQKIQETLQKVQAKQVEGGNTAEVDNNRSDTKITSVKKANNLDKFVESWSVDILENRSEQIKNQLETAKIEAKEIQSSIEMFMQSNDDLRAQLDNVKIKSATVQFTFTMPANKRITDGSLKEDIENFIGVEGVFISTKAGRILIDVPLENTVLLDSQKLLTDGISNKKLPPLAALFGGDENGNPVVIDIAKLPHLLAAGTTGSGKSVGLNQIILSIMKHNTPYDVQFLLVDPKRVELGIYKGNPFLLSEPIVDVELMDKALEYVVEEMEHRYELLAQYDVRNISGYNKKRLAEGNKKLPFLVVVVDEISDMMMTASKQVESYIVRIGQKARAAGIHFIGATQRPSADVITGLIKANIPSRLSYAVSDGNNSRIILDELGAEELLGKGDSLLKVVDSRGTQRIQSIFIDDTEVQRILQAIKELFGETPKVDIKKWADEKENGEEDLQKDIFSPAPELFENKQSKSNLVEEREEIQLAYAREKALIERNKQDGLAPFTPEQNQSFFDEVYAEMNKQANIEEVRSSAIEANDTSDSELFEKTGLSELFDSNNSNSLLESKTKTRKREVPEDINLEDGEIEAIVLDFDGEDLQALMASFDSSNALDSDDSEQPVPVVATDTSKTTVTSDRLKRPLDRSSKNRIVKRRR